MSKPKKHNRKGPKSTRGGCLFCKPWKRQGTKLADRQRASVTKKMTAIAKEEIKDMSAVDDLFSGGVDNYRWLLENSDL